MTTILKTVESALEQMKNAKLDFDDEAERVHKSLQDASQEIEKAENQFDAQIKRATESLLKEIEALRAELVKVQQAAANAQTTATTGVSKAEAAQTIANQSGQKAEAAKQTAEDGVKRADNAQTTANTAVANIRAGKLGKLDVAEEFNAVVRCADFRMGHSSRHGGVGRALVDNGQTLTLNYGPDWKDGVDVKGELRARLWISEEFQWKQGEPDVKMCHSDDCFAFLTRVQGSFAGGGEKVRVYIGKDGHWYLGGSSLQQDVLARARCVGRPG